MREKISNFESTNYSIAQKIKSENSLVRKFLTNGLNENSL